MEDGEVLSDVVEDSERVAIATVIVLLASQSLSAW